MKLTAALMGLFASVVLMAGCASQEEPARKAVETLEANLSTVRDDAAKYAPEALQAVDDKIAKLKSELANKKYKDVLGQAQAVNTDITSLHDAIVSKQTLAAAAANEWNELKEAVPKTLADIQARVDGLKGGKLPKEVKKEDYESAKTSLEQMKAMWAEATAAGDAGQTVEATDKARQVETTGAELRTKLGMTPA